MISFRPTTHFEISSTNLSPRFAYSKNCTSHSPIIPLQASFPSIAFLVGVALLCVTFHKVVGRNTRAHRLFLHVVVVRLGLELPAARRSTRTIREARFQGRLV